METNEIRQVVAETGKQLLEQRLVARTWGNVSCRINDHSYAITPSGLDYMHMKAEDIVIMNMDDGTWQGNHKPSGERGIHTAAYQTHKNAGFVIHTHQNYATALGLADSGNMRMTEEERLILGGIALAGYGLPGTGKLSKNVRSVLETGANVVLMAHHGALICGTDREDAFAKAILLEKICERSLRGQPKENEHTAGDAAAIMKELGAAYSFVGLTNDAAVLKAADGKSPIMAQLDDMAQMIGHKIPIVQNDSEDIVNGLKHTDAVLVPGIGAMVKAETEDDRDALCLLVEKACVSALHTEALGVKGKLPYIDMALMRFVYQQKYSKQK